MKTFKFCSLAFALVSCGTPQELPIQEPVPKEIEHLEPVDQLYAAELPKVQDERGWVETDECDAMLWNSLLAAVGAAIDIVLARDELGKYHRTWKQDCFASGRSASEFSKDMATGLAWWMWRSYGEELAKAYLKFVRANWLFMGNGPPSRTLMSSNLYRTFSIIAAEKNPPIEDKWEVPGPDHSRHVVVLHILLRIEMKETVQPDMKDVIKAAYEGDRNNGLFAYAYHKITDGDQTEAINILSDSQLFPRDRLPDNIARCGRWLWERESSSKHWKPCETSRIHSGGDFRFLYNLIKRDYLNKP